MTNKKFSIFFLAFFLSFSYSFFAPNLIRMAPTKEEVPQDANEHCPVSTKRRLNSPGNCAVLVGIFGFIH
jgi:hypothetical protein